MSVRQVGQALVRFVIAALFGVAITVILLGAIMAGSVIRMWIDGTI